MLDDVGWVMLYFCILANYEKELVIRGFGSPSIN